MEPIQTQGQAYPLMHSIASVGRSVAYVPNFAIITGSAIAALLLQQMIFWWQVKKGHKFYKFKIPAPKHKAYSDGDSWCEELALTRHEFDTALKRIATKIDATHTREAFYKHQIPRRDDFIGYEDAYGKALEETVKHFVAYWTDSDRKTWYEVNGNLIEVFLNQAMEPKAGFQLYLCKSRFRLYQIKRDSGFTYTENTTEKNYIEDKTIASSDEDALCASAQSASHGGGDPTLEKSAMVENTPPSKESIADPLQSSAKVSPADGEQSSVGLNEFMTSLAESAARQAGKPFDRAAFGKVLAKAGSTVKPASTVPASGTVAPPVAAVTTGAATRATLPEPPAGCEWWFAADNAGVAHLKVAGKSDATRPLCKPSRWRMPNKCMPFQVFSECEECNRIASAPKAERPRKEAINQVLKDAVAIHLQGIDPALAGDTTWLIANKAAAVWKKKLGRALTAEDYEKIARSLDKNSERGFPRWYYKQCKDCNLPSESPRKFESWYSKFVTALDKSNESEVTNHVDDTDFTPEYADWLRKQVAARTGE